MRTLVVVLSLFALGACSKKESEPSKRELPATPSAGAPATPPAPPAPPVVEPPTAGAPVAKPAEPAAGSTCSFADKAKVEAAVGKLDGDPTPGQPHGSLLGQCEYHLAGGGMAMVSAFPADQYDSTVRGGKDIAGLGTHASSTKEGVMVQLAGKPYFLHVMVAGAGGIDDAKSTALAKLMAAGAP